jgi:hypothetical protein
MDRAYLKNARTAVIPMTQRPRCSHFYCSVQAALIKQNCVATMDDLDLSELLRFVTTNKDDCMQMLVVAIVFFSRWPLTTTFSTLLCLVQIHFGFVPQDHDYWNGLAMQAAATWITSTQLGRLSKPLFGYCWSKARDACFSAVKSLIVWPVSFAIRVAIIGCIVMYWSILHFCRFVASATVRLVRASLARTLVAFNGNIDIPDDEIDHDTLDDFHYDSMYESESDYELEDEDYELEYDSDVSNDEAREARESWEAYTVEQADEEYIEEHEENEANEAHEAGEVDGEGGESTLTGDSTMMPNGLHPHAFGIRSGSQSSNVRRIADYCKKVSDESDTGTHSE